MPFKHAAILFLLFTAASAISHQSGLDQWLAHAIYNLEGGTGPGDGFLLRHNFWTKTVLHDYGRKLVKRLWFLDVLLFISSFFFQKISRYRGIFLYIAVATVVSASLISTLKHLTTIPCPQSLLEFGGERQWINIWQIFSPNQPLGKCYPAGHSSGGYGWLCLAMVFPYRGKAFYWMLLPGTLLGLTFGITQQLRGAHFLSHDLLTIALVVFLSATVFYGMQSLSKLKPAIRSFWQGIAESLNSKF
mgnify:CR=1 FL=1